MHSILSFLLFLYTASHVVLAADRKPGGPVHPGQPANCAAWHTVKKGDDCDSVAQKYYLSRKQFLAWNPAVSEDCAKNFWLGSAYCVAVDESKATGVSGTSSQNAVSSEVGTSSVQSRYNGATSSEATTSMATEKTTGSSSAGSLSSTSAVINQPTSHNATRSATTTYSVRHPVSTWNITTPTIDKTWPPKATLAGQPENCNKWHLVRGGQSCQTVINRYSAFMKKEEFFEWNPEVHKDCSGLFVGYWVCVGIRSNATADLDWSSSVPPFTPPPEPTKHTRTTLTPSKPEFTPTPSHGPMPGNCLNFHKAEANETCREILETYNYLSKDQFFKYNPALKKNCDGLWEGNWYCVGVKDELPLPPTATSSPSSVPDGSPKDCKVWYYTTGGETCDAIAEMFGTFNSTGFISMNPSVDEDCDEIENNTWHCVAVSDTPTTRTVDLPTPATRVTTMPTQKGITPDCKRYWFVSRKDSCKSIERANGITHERFVAWNKAIGNGCPGLKPDYYVCVST